MAMEEGISKLEYREGDIKRPVSPLSIGFTGPYDLDKLENGKAGSPSVSIPSTPVSHKPNSVTFDDKVKDLEADEEDEKKKKGYRKTLRFGFFPPKGVVGKILTRLLTILVWFGVMWGVLGPLALPAPPPDASHSSGGGLVCNSSSSSNDHDIDDHYCTFNLSHTFQSLSEEHCPNKSFEEDYIVNDPHSVRNGYGPFVSMYNASGDLNCTPSGYQTCVEECLCATHPPSGHNEHDDLLDPPPGHFFGLFMLTIVATFFGFLAHAIRLPHLFGMMIGGILLNNIPVIGVAKNISHSWSSVIRTSALVIVLIRGGLSMEMKALRTLFPPIAALGILPCVCEALTIFLISTWWTYEGNWAFGLMQGFLDAAISPSVLVPSLLNLEDHGYGVDEGIPTMLIVSAAFDDVICISLFGVFLAIIFNSGPLAFSIFRGPLEVVLGLVFGIGFGLLLWYIPPKDFKKGSIVRNRLTLLLGLALFSFFASQRMEFYNSPGFIGAGALGILCLAFVASVGWKRGLCTKKIIDRTFFLIWQFIEPLLFGLIGAEIDFSAINVSLIGEALTLAFGGLLVRTTSVFIITLFLKFTWKERLFVVIAWIPKATIQAAISGYPVTVAAHAGGNIEDCELKNSLVQSVQTVAIFEIIIAAPVGALLIGLLGPRLLKKSGVDLREEERNEMTEEEIEEQQWLEEHPEEVNMEHYHHHHHDDLFEIHDPIPEVIHWSETHCLGCVHRAFQCLKGQKTHGEYELNEPRAPKRARSYQSSLNSPSLRGSRTPDMSSRPVTPVVSPSNDPLHALRTRPQSTTSSHSPLIRSMTAPPSVSPLYSLENQDGGRPHPQRLQFNFSSTLSNSSEGPDIPNLPHSPTEEATLV